VSAKLRQTDQRFRLLVESVTDYGIFILDLGGHVESWNQGAERILGYSAPEILGKHFSCFYTPEANAHKKPADDLQRARIDEQVREQGWWVRKDGSLFWASVAITGMHNTRGKLLGFAYVLRDVHLRKSTEAKLRTVRKQLRLLKERVRENSGNVHFSSKILREEQTHIRKIEAAKTKAEKVSKAKDDFLAVLSHELRTPLTPALAAAGYLADHVSNLPADLREEIATIRRNIQLEARLIDDLLDFTRIIRGKMELHFEIVDAHRVLREIIEVVGDDIIDKELDFGISLFAREHHIWADPVRIRQVFWNLVRNAVKFTPWRGHVGISSSNDKEGRFQLEVSDTGIGIEPEQQSRVFNAFEQESHSVTREFSGLGLGLTISKSLLDLHGGRIEVESRGKNCGASFKVTLDTLHEDELASEQPIGDAFPSPKTLRILLVEDHADTRRTLSRLLTRVGHKVSSTDHVESALSLLDSRRFDTLVSDIGLPDRSGYELVSLAKQRHQFKAIALSGFGMEEDVRRSLAAGFDHHVTKPVDFQTLRNLLSQMAV
jgi:PAS domain S-box-containing protein